MLFNSFDFIFVFLPIVFIGYFVLNRFNTTAGKLWLLVSSFIFYSYINPIFLPILLGSIVVNYLLGVSITKSSQRVRKKWLLTVGIVFNVSLLGFFKYYDFFIANINTVFQTDFNFLNLALPLAISFYTFQQIAYLVDSYKREVIENRFLNYALFIAFFPQLIAGPIVHHKEMMPQYTDIAKKRINWENISKGLFIFAIGLFKKVAIADTFAVWANNGYDQAASLTFFDGWITSLSYTFQLYFDFSGYSDMAIGLALLFNIKIPINFNSPYKAVNIKDFWRRWHITLSRFLTQYIYIPLGGNRISNMRTYINIFIIFFISGFWHGAGWTFILWGSMHGVAMIIQRAWSNMGMRMNWILAWFITFMFINATWVFFRASDFQTALQVLKSMIGLNGFAVPETLASGFNWQLAGEQLYQFTLSGDLWQTLIYIIGAFIIVLFTKNAMQLTQNLKPNPLYAIFAAVLFIIASLQLNEVSEFLYFNF